MEPPAVQVELVADVIGISLEIEHARRIDANLAKQGAAGLAGAIHPGDERPFDDLRAAAVRLAGKSKNESARTFLEHAQVAREARLAERVRGPGGDHEPQLAAVGGCDDAGRRRGAVEPRDLQHVPVQVDRHAVGDGHDVGAPVRIPRKG